MGYDRKQGCSRRREGRQGQRFRRDQAAQVRRQLERYLARQRPHGPRLFKADRSRRGSRYRDLVRDDDEVDRPRSDKEHR